MKKEINESWIGNDFLPYMEFLGFPSTKKLAIKKIQSDAAKGKNEIDIKMAIDFLNNTPEEEYKKLIDMQRAATSESKTKEDNKMNKKINEGLVKISQDIIKGLQKGGILARIKEVGLEAALMTFKGKADFIYLLSKAVNRIISPEEFKKFREYVDTEVRSEVLALMKRYSPNTILLYEYAKFKHETTAVNIEDFIKELEEAAKINSVIGGEGEPEGEEEVNTDDDYEEEPEEEMEEPEEPEPENNDEIPESKKEETEEEVNEKKKMPEGFKKYLEKKKAKAGKKGKKEMKKEKKEDKKEDKKEEKKADKKVDEGKCYDNMTPEVEAEVEKKKKIFLGEEAKEIFTILKNPLNLRAIIKESKTDADAKELFSKIVEVVETKPDEAKKALGESRFFLIKTEIASNIGMMKAIKGQNKMLSEEIYWDAEKKNK